MRRTVSLLCFLGIFLAIFGASSLRAATQFALVTGSVFDKRTGDPVAGATVRLINATTGFAESQLTDASGEYTFPSVPPAEDYVLSAEKTGYETSFKPDMKFTVGDSSLVEPPIGLNPIEPAVKPAPPAAPVTPTEQPPQTAEQKPVETPPEVPAQPKVEAKEIPPAQPEPAAPAQPQPAAPAQPEPTPAAKTTPPPPTPAAPAPPAPAMTTAAAATAGVTVSLDRVSTMLGGVVDSRAVHTLPLSNRDFLDLALLVAGTYPVEQGSNLEGASLVVNGTRANMNNFMLDGVDNNDYTINQSLPFQIVEALQEFRVQTGTSPAEYGRSGGAQINSVARSGTNKFHGTLFEFNRNSALSSEYPLTAYRGGTFDAFVQDSDLDRVLYGPNHFFPTPVLSDPVLSRLFESGRDPHFNQNQFGANLGGPVAKNKAFFFFNWESSRGVVNRPDFERVPDRNCRDAVTCAAEFGTSPFFDGSAAVLTGLMKLYPEPNVPQSTVLDGGGHPVSDPNLADFYSNGAFYTGAAQNFTNSDNFLGRIDYRVGPRASLSFKHNLQDINQVQGGSIPKVSQYPGNGISLTGRNQNFSTNLVYSLSPRTVNELRLGWNRFRLNTLPLDHTLDASQYFKNLNFKDKGLPEILIGGFDPAGFTFGPYASLGANFTAPAYRADNLYSVTDNLSWMRGHHTIKFGGEARYNRLDVNNEAMERGLVTFFNMDWAARSSTADIASIARVAPEFGGVNGTGGMDRSFRANSFAGFIQDNWRPRPNVSINLGVRYEVNQAPVESRNRLVNDYPGICGSGSIVCLIRAGTNAILRSDGTSLGTANFTASRAGFNTDYNNFGPHVGIAWSPGRGGKTVLRASGAVMFDQQALEPSANMLLNPPFVQQSMAFGYLPGSGVLSILSDTFPAGFLNQAVLSDAGGEGFGSLWFPQAYSITARDRNSRTPYVYQFNFGIERQLGDKAMFEIGYAGSVGHKLLRNRLLLECTNTIFEDSTKYSTCLPSFGGIYPGGLSDSVVNEENTANSNFHSLIARLETRSFHGLSVHAHYQWAHSIDNASSATPPVFLLSPASADLISLLFNINADQFASLNNANPALSLRAGLPTITTQALLPSDSSNSPNLAGERANSNFDVRHLFAVYYIYELPAVQKLRALGNGWELAGITTVQSGRPFTVFGDFFGDPLRPNVVSSAPVNFSDTRSAFDNAIPVGCNVAYPCLGTAAKSAFDPTSNAFFSSGALPRNSYTGPGSANFDFSILKNTYFGAEERMNVQIRVEAFNLLNHTNLLQPFTQYGQVSNLPGSNTGYEVQNPFFGQILHARPPREIQFALKFIF